MSFIGLHLIHKFMIVAVQKKKLFLTVKLLKSYILYLPAMSATGKPEGRLSLGQSNPGNLFYFNQWFMGRDNLYYVAILFPFPARPSPIGLILP